MNKQTNLVWIDLEMTGLRPEKNVIIEIAVVVTDNNLNIIKEGPSIAIYQKPELLSAMDAWNTEQHNKSNLIRRVKNSKISTKQAEVQVLDFLIKYVHKGMSPMCGNTICQDRRFLYNYMPTLENFFHYRHIDVSTLKELSKRWQKQENKQFNKKSNHLALDDIYNSINELKHYRSTFIKI